MQNQNIIDLFSKIQFIQGIHNLIKTFYGGNDKAIADERTFVQIFCILIEHANYYCRNI